MEGIILYYLLPFVGIEARFSSLIESTAANLRGPHVSYLVEGPTATFDESHHSVILHGNNLNSVSQLPINTNTNKCSAKIVSCSEFLPTKRHDLSSIREVRCTKLNLLCLFCSSNDQCQLWDIVIFGHLPLLLLLSSHEIQYTYL